MGDMQMRDGVAPRARQEREPREVPGWLRGASAESSGSRTHAGPRLFLRSGRIALRYCEYVWISANPDLYSLIYHESLREQLKINTF